jgi:hypothetical protein
MMAPSAHCIQKVKLAGVIVQLLGLVVLGLTIYASSKVSNGYVWLAMTGVWGVCLLLIGWRLSILFLCGHCGYHLRNKYATKCPRCRANIE